MKHEKLEMRELSGGDIFAILEIVDKMGILESLQEYFEDVQKETKEMQTIIIDDLVSQGRKIEDITTDEIMKDPRAMQLQSGTILKILKLAIKNIPKAKNEINTFLADITKTSKKTIHDLPIKSYLELITDFFKKPELGELLESINEFI